MCAGPINLINELILVNNYLINKLQRNAYYEAAFYLSFFEIERYNFENKFYFPFFRYLKSGSNFTIFV